MDERMEAIMRKLTAMALSMMFILGSIIPVGAEETQTRQSTISVSIDPVYTENSLLSLEVFLLIMQD